MQQESNNAATKIADILRERGDDLNQYDLDEIDVLTMDIAPVDLPDVMPWIMEAVAMTVNAPHYAGDIPPSE